MYCAAEVSTNVSVLMSQGEEGVVLPTELFSHTDYEPIWINR